MALTEIDQTLARLREAAVVISANLVEVESSPSWRFLQAASLIGDSATRRAETNRAFSDLWRWFGRFNELLDDAAKLRGTRNRLSPGDEGRLSTLLSGPSIELASIVIPLADRDLLGQRSSTTHCTADELLTFMSAAFDRAKGMITASSQVWDSLLPRFRAAEAELNRLTELATSLGGRAAPDAAGLGARLATVGETIVRDPLAVAARDLDQVESELAAFRADVDAAAKLRSDVVNQLSRAQAMMDDLHSEARAAAEANREVLEKICSPDVPAPIPVDQTVIRQLSKAEALSNEGQWLLAQRELAACTRRARDLLHRLQENHAANRSPIKDRNQLRGRLDAYRAKVHRLRLTEDPSLCALYDAAWDALYTAPTDLQEAAESVRRYQQAVPTDPPRRVPM